MCTVYYIVACNKHVYKYQANELSIFFRVKISSSSLWELCFF